jgi:hypothetical protein
VLVKGQGEAARRREAKCSVVAHDLMRKSGEEVGEATSGAGEQEEERREKIEIKSGVGKGQERKREKEGDRKRKRKGKKGSSARSSPWGRRPA